MKLDRRQADAVARASLAAFVYQSSFPLTGKRLERSWHIDALCWRLEHLHLPHFRHQLVINMPPRSLKSYITSICYPAWRLGLDPALEIIVATYGEDLSKHLSRQNRDLMGTPFYRRLFPGARISRRKDTETEFVTTRGGSRFSTTVGGALTGRGCDILIVDDPIKVQDAFSEIARENVIEWFNGTAMTRLNEPTKSQVVVLMHRLHTRDLAGVLIEQGYPKLIIPALAEVPARYRINSTQFYYRKPGNILQKRMGNHAKLMEIKEKLGSRVFAGQYQQNPMPVEGVIIKKEWLKRYDRASVPSRFDRLVITCDPALKHGSHNDYTAIMAVGILGKSIYPLDVQRGHWPSPDIKSQIERMAEGRRVELIIIEDTAAGPGVCDQLASNHRLSVREWPVDRNKIERLERQQAKFECGQIYLPEAAHWLAEFEHELLSFPNGRYDDQVDAFLIALEWYDTIKGEFVDLPHFIPILLKKGRPGSYDRFSQLNGDW